MTEKEIEEMKARLLARGYGGPGLRVFLKSLRREAACSSSS